VPETEASNAAKPFVGSAARARFAAARYRTAILEKLDQGLTVQRIWQDLGEEFGYGASYESVKRFVRTLAPTRRAVGVFHCAPGADYGESDVMLRHAVSRWDVGRTVLVGPHRPFHNPAVRALSFLHHRKEERCFRRGTRARHEIGIGCLPRRVGLIESAAGCLSSGMSTPQSGIISTSGCDSLITFRSAVLADPRASLTRSCARTWPDVRGGRATAMVGLSARRSASSSSQTTAAIADAAPGLPHAMSRAGSPAL
jgi:hypothetical protein